MIDQDFCTYLEFEITKALSNSPNEEIKYFWCDGILLPNSYEYSQKIINDKRYLRTTAFVGLDGQVKYDMTIHFGKKALSRYARSLSLNECIPDSSNDDWVVIDIEKKAIDIRLN